MRQTLAPAASPADLTARQRQVAELAVAGLGNKAIALRLSLCDRTVKNHLSLVLRRTSCQSRWELMRWWRAWEDYAAGRATPEQIDWPALDYTPAVAAALLRLLELRIRQLPPHYCQGKTFVHAAGVIECLRFALTGASRRPEER